MMAVRTNAVIHLAVITASVKLARSWRKMAEDVKDLQMPAESSHSGLLCYDICLTRAEPHMGKSEVFQLHL